MRWQKIRVEPGRENVFIEIPATESLDIGAEFVDLATSLDRAYGVLDAE